MNMHTMCKQQCKSNELGREEEERGEVHAYQISVTYSKGGEDER